MYCFIQYQVASTPATYLEGLSLNPGLNEIYCGDPQSLSVIDVIVLQMFLFTSCHLMLHNQGI